VKNAEALHQTLYKHYTEATETTPRINKILVWLWRFARNLMTPLQLANCYFTCSCCGDWKRCSEKNNHNHILLSTLADLKGAVGAVAPLLAQNIFNKPPLPV